MGEHAWTVDTLPIMSWPWNLLTTAAVAYIVSTWFRYQRALARVHDLPGTRFLFDPQSSFSFVSPRVRWLTVGTQYGWDFRHSMFNGCKWETHTVAGVLSGTSGYITSNIYTIKQIFGPRSSFVKCTKDYKSLGGFGPNLVVTEGEQWKRMRRICAPAFSDRNNTHVWVTTTELVDEMTATWPSCEPVTVDDICVDVTIPLALCVIAKAGFGQAITWADTAPPPTNHKLTFKKALTVVADNIFLPLILPNWAWGLRTHWRVVKEAYDEALTYLNEMIDSRRNPSVSSASDVLEKDDLFSQLLDAHEEGEQLTTEELLGNIFIFLIAGHETTSHTLGFLFGLLALYPEEQDKLLAHIEQNRPHSRDFGYEDMHNLNYAMAILYETLRLYPSVINIPKITSGDVHMNLGSSKSIFVPSDTHIAIHVVGLHHNPDYWDNPYEFLPSRFLDPNWNRDAFIPFSAGPRSCIGRRFAETTIIAMIVQLLPKYKISINEEHFKPIVGETITERRERFLNARSILTLAPQKLSLVFTPRNEAS